MHYKDFIMTNEGFQYSINLQYDLNNLFKLNSYIPTKESVEILDKYLKSIYYKSSDRATVLVGPYGKGKSHLLLVLLTLISIDDEVYDKDNDLRAKEVINILIEKISSINESTAKLIKEVREVKKPILPIIINSNYMDLNQSFLIGLKEALKLHNLQGLIPNTYFDSVLEVVEKWSNNYKESYDKFKEQLKEYGLTIRKFKSSIKNYDKNTYKIFKQIYPKITSGAEFNPLLNSDIVGLFKQINDIICDTGKYSGMFIVFDEFSKFLDSNIQDDASNNLKIIQDFAELSNRSGKNQIHLACITHRAFGDYLVNIPQKRIVQWRTVEGRFTHIYFTSSSQENYELISNAIIKDKDKFEVFKSSNQEEFNKIDFDCNRIDLFSEVFDWENIIVRGCFPLNPITVYALPRISEKVAQNERTIFTFLSKNEKGTLAKFIENNSSSMELLTLDMVFDYFEVLFKKEVFNINIHDTWLKAHKCLSKVNNKICKQIIKSLAIINIVNEFEKFTPTDIILQMSLGLSQEKYDEAMSYLINKHIILKNKSNGFYRFSLLNNFNINKNIENVKNLKLHNSNTKVFLEEIIDLGYVLPKKYNDEKEMTRFFKNVFITWDELKNFNNIREILDFYKADGVILHYIYVNDEELHNAIEKLKYIKDKRILLCIPNLPFQIEERLKDYAAVRLIQDDKEIINSEDYIMEELNLYLEDVVYDIKNYINENFYIQNGNCKLFNYNGEIKNINKRIHLTRYVSDICKNVYSKTPIINNELINKMNLTSPIKKARKNIIDYILNDLENGVENINLSRRGPEITIFKSTIYNKNLLSKMKKTEPEIFTILHKIDKFILSSEGNKKSFLDIYESLCNEPYGLRKGIIPIYIAFKIRDRKEDIVIYFEDKEVPLSSNILDSINDNPENYFLYVEKGTKEKDTYIKSLYDIFTDVDNQVNEYSYNKFISIVKCMQEWMQSLPKYTREYEKVFSVTGIKELESNKKLFRKELLKFNINPRELLFDIMNKKIFKGSSYYECLNFIEELKQEFDLHIYNLREYLVQQLKNIIAPKKCKGSLASLLINWYKDLDQINKKYVYDESTNEVLKLIKDLDTFNDEQIISKLAFIITNLNIEDWQDNKVDDFLNKFKKIINEVNLSKDISNEGSMLYKINFCSKDGTCEKIFEEEDISPLGQTLFNEIEQTIDDYGDSLEDNEKRNILMKIMERFM